MSIAEKKLQNKVVNAAKWSFITEIATKVVSPITNMILARILAPEAFGVVTTVTMIISFADMFTDAGFQKYLVQHEFKDECEKHQNANVAFWSNLAISIFLWGVIALSSERIAILVGNPGLGHVITIACVQLVLTSFSSIQMALYKRDFDFKTLFLVRLVAICLPFVITIPLALVGLNYWALVIGAICMQFSNAIVLTIKSKWKPRLFYNMTILKKMLRFSIWSLVEAISIWFTVWVDVFIISSSMNAYYLGLFKTSVTMVNALMSLITASVIPILFSALSRLQNDSKQFNHMYFSIQKLISIIVFPMGIGIYLYRDLATQILLGIQWSEASGIIGVWALTSSIMVVLCNLCSEVYRSKGRPRVSFLAQILHLVVLVPVCIISSRYGFWTFVFARSLIRIQFVFVHFIIMEFVVGISVLKTLRNIFPTAASAMGMGIIGLFLKYMYKGTIWDIVSIIICGIFYFGLLYLFPSMRKELMGIRRKISLMLPINKLFTKNETKLDRDCVNENIFHQNKM
jgi:PST family polysaccharide transporter